jgi:acetyl esterase/lipase
MLHEKIEIKHEQESATLFTYILDNSPQIDPDRKRPLVVICPGGGYEYTSDREAEPIAIRLNGMGLHACILRYSVKPAVFPSALCQLANAIGLVREHAVEWNVDPNKVIVMGFSAGGHLAASLGVFWNNEIVTERITYTKEQIKPNGMILSYPVITSGPFAHRGSFDALLGEGHEDEKLLNLVSLENHVSIDTPPTFLWHTTTDEAVPVENSFLFGEAILKSKGSLEMHIYPKGVHGLALGTEETKSTVNQFRVLPEVANWIEMAGRWIIGL